ncbi:spore coat protein U domain-containing protein [Ralstonia solanacearum]
MQRLPAARRGGAGLPEPGGGQRRHRHFADSARSVVWGGRTTPATPAIQVDVSLGLLGIGPATVTVYGRVPSGQTTTPAGTYTQSFEHGRDRVRASESRFDHLLVHHLQSDHLLVEHQRHPRQ